MSNSTQMDQPVWAAYDWTIGDSRIDPEGDEGDGTVVIPEGTKGTLFYIDEDTDEWVVIWDYPFRGHELGEMNMPSDICEVDDPNA